MEIKKSSEADLEPYRATWLLVGFIVALSVLFVAFEWSEQDEADDLDALLSDMVFEEELVVPVVEHPTVVPPLPAPVAPPPAVEEKVEVVEDEDAEMKETVAPSSEQVPGEGDMVDAQPADVPQASAGTDEPYIIVDELPEFPTDGLRGLMRYLTQHIRYPQTAWQHNVQGTVLCQFIVNADGSIADVQVVQGVQALLDREAVRVLKTMPRWKPGKIGGKPVRVRFTLPVVFKLQ